MNENYNAANDPRMQAAAQRFADNMMKYPEEEKLAIFAISKNVLNGCSWEFVRKATEYVKAREAFASNKNVQLHEVVYDHSKNLSGYLVYMNMNYLCSVLAKEAPGLIRKEDLTRASQHRQEAIQSLYAKMKTGYKGRIGIYCTNDSQTITIKGRTFPAYAVSLPEMLQIAERCNYAVYVNNTPRAPREVAKHGDAVLRALEVAPSGNALFINIGPNA